MKKTLNKKTIVLFIAASIVLTAAGAFYLTRRSSGFASGDRLSVFFYNPSSCRVEPESRIIPDGLNYSDVLESLVSMLFEQPKNASLQRVAPEREGFLDRYELSGNTLSVFFTEEYFGFSPLDEAFFRASLIWTATELSSVDNLIIYVDGVNLHSIRGDEFEYFNRENVVLDPEI
ncbi:MAG: GerMN domain-containing protein, partial [Defluviitaleaceae bacterium]|nr:GerMN domain-containing protein [Defluviitaleaceae bacterium]